MEQRMRAQGSIEACSCGHIRRALSLSLSPLLSHTITRALSLSLAPSPSLPLSFTDASNGQWEKQCKEQDPFCRCHTPLRHCRRCGGSKRRNTLIRPSHATTAASRLRAHTRTHTHTQHGRGDSAQDRDSGKWRRSGGGGGGGGGGRGGGRRRQGG